MLFVLQPNIVLVMHDNRFTARTTARHPASGYVCMLYCTFACHRSTSHLTSSMYTVS